MSYPQQVPPGWTRGEPVRVVVSGPRQCAIARDLSAFDIQACLKDEFCITFDTVKDGEAWLKWWRQPLKSRGK